MSLRYLDVSDGLRAQLTCGLLADGAVLPSEIEFTRIFNVSRTTIRAALRKLEDEGILERRQGSGTYYRSPKQLRRISSKVDFLTANRMSGHVPATKLLNLAKREPSIAEFALFGHPSREGVVELKRLRLTDGSPSVLQTSVLPFRQLENYPKSEFEKKSLYAILERDFGVSISRVHETLDAGIADPGSADILHIESGDPVFRSHRIAKDKEGKVVEASSNIIRSDRYSFTFDGSTREFMR